MKNLFFVFAITFSCTASAQQINWALGTSGGNDHAEASSVVHTNAGYTVVVGQLNAASTSDFNPGASATNNLTGLGANDGFVACYDASGNYAWAFSLGQAGGDVYANDVTADDSGNVIVTGTLHNVNVDFDPGPGTTMCSSGPGECVFLAKYAPAGQLTWVILLGTTTSSIGHGITVTTTTNGQILLGGDIYVVFQGSFDFDPGPGTHLVTTPGTHGFLAQFDRNGNFRRVITLNETKVRGIASNSRGDIVASGEIVTANTNVDFDPGPGVHTLSFPSNNSCAFVTTYDSTGSYRWAFPVISNNAVYGRTVVTDNARNVYVGFVFLGTNVDFDPGPGVTAFSANFSDLSSVPARYDSTGALVWAFAVKGATTIDIDADAGGLYLTGFSSPSSVLPDFDPGPATDSLTQPGIFLVKYSFSGSLLWLVGVTNNPCAAKGHGVDADANGNVFIAGYFDAQLDFDPTSAVWILNPSGSYSMFAAKYSNGPQGIAPVEPGTTWRLCPNPARNSITLSGDEPVEGTLCIRTTHGALVLQQAIRGSAQTLALDDLAAGLYFVALQTEKGTQVFRLVKE